MKKIIHLKALIIMLLLTVAIYETNAQAVVVRRPRAVVYRPYYAYPVARVARPVRVIPPTRVVVSTLPVGYRTCWYGAIPYYYYDGVYYVKAEETESYEAVQPPIGTIVTELPKGATQNVIDKTTYYEYQEVLYKQIQFDSNIKYEVVGYTTK